MDRYRRRIEIRRDEVMGMQQAIALAAGIATVCTVVLVPLIAITLWALGRTGATLNPEPGLLAAVAVWAGFWLGLSAGPAGGFALALQAWDASSSVAVRRRQALEAVAAAEAVLAERR